MTVLVPRIPREAAREIIAEAREVPPARLASSMPREVSVHLSPVGGRRIEDAELRALREALVEVAERHGYPEARSQSGDVSFDADAAVVLRAGLDISPNEASAEEVWSYLTCCWLLDLALWRFGGGADERRLYGDINRNAFRRLWWRAEILGVAGGPDGPFRGLGEDELVSIMERPTLARDARLARAIVTVFSDAAPTLRDRGLRRMDVMRDVTKRILRLTPFVEVAALADGELRDEVAHQLDRAIAAMLGGEPPVAPAPTPVDNVSGSVEVLDDLTSAEEPPRLTEEDTDEIATLALDIARRTGRVTNMMLREMAPTLGSADAREVFDRLMREGRLERRGEKRGTHYVIPAGAPPPSVDGGRRSVLRRLLDRRS